jgi:fucose 4-O-acetylase-like acetyltransferase
MRTFVEGVRRRAAATPAHRERHVDFLRAVAICVVVIGHWLVIAGSHKDGELTGVNALNVLTWAHPLTWVFQVMPVFFLVGGFANAASLTSYEESGGDKVTWLHVRTDRLLRPVTALFVVVPLTAVVAVLAGAPEDLVGTATWLASIPLWFLLAYLAMVVLAPWTYALHRRFGLAVPVAMLGLVILADALRLGLGVSYVGESTYVVAWLAIHQLGYCWRDGRLPVGSRGALVWTACALAVVVALTVAGPYDVRMVGANTDPPTVALMALAATQAGVVLLIQPAVSRWLQQMRPWSVVVAFNAVVLTVFGWHMTAAVIAAVALFPTGVLAQPDVGSASWLLWRLPWLAACAVVLAALVAVFARIELRPADAERAAPGFVRDLLTFVGVLAVLGGLLGVALAGRDYHGWGGLPPAAVLSYLAGAAVLRWVRSGRLNRRDHES